MKGNSERGGAALEYIMVTTFAAVVSIAALGFIGKVIKDQLAKMSEKLGVDADLDGITPPFGPDDP